MADQANFPDIYIDGSSAGDGSLATPYSDFSDINWTTGGDNSVFDYYAGAEAASLTINFKKGVVWRERCIIGGSGSATYPILIQAYDSGDDPVIKGSNAVVTWADQTGNVWKAPYATGDPVQVFFVETDDSITWGNEVANVGALAAEYDWVWDSNELYCYTAVAGGDPDTRYSFVEATAQEQCIYSSAKDYITVSDLEMCFAIKYAVETRVATSFVIDNNTLHHIGAKNVSQADGLIHRDSTNCIASNNLVYECGTHGIFIYTQAGNTTSGAIVENNEVYNCHHTLIDTINANGTASGTIIRYNKLYNTSDYDTDYLVHGIYVQGANGSNQDAVHVYYNVLYDMAGNGIHLGSYSTNCDVFNNVAYRRLSGSSQDNYGIFISGTNLSGHNIKNNISLDGTTGCLYVQNSSQVSTCENNLWYNTVTVNNYVIVANLGSSPYGVGDFATYQSESGWDTNGLWESPSFIDKASENFYLDTGSPCINTGVDVSLTEDYVGHPIISTPDMGAYEFQYISIGAGSYVLTGKNVTFIKTEKEQLGGYGGLGMQLDMKL